MRTIVHLSDLHFGRVDPQLPAPLARCVQALEPDVVVVSGDLTQRARVEQFVEARQFLDTLPKPQIVVPGNHDVPLYNVYRRFARPLARYRRYVTDELEPAFVDAEIAVVGVNTARSLTIKGGRVNHEQLGRVRLRLCRLDPNLVKIVVTHHPFDLPQGVDDSEIVGRAQAAMAVFAQCGADLLLAGHLHLGHIASTAQRYDLGGYAALAVQAGTATSTRGRGEPNSFNVLRVQRPQVTIERWQWQAAAHEFAQADSESFALS